MAEEERILEVTPDFDGKRIDPINPLAPVIKIDSTSSVTNY